MHVVSSKMVTGARLMVIFFIVCVFLLFQDIQTEAPFHLLHLKVEVERSKLMVSLQECQAEVTRENRHLASMGSERLIKEHRVSTEWLTAWLSFNQSINQFTIY